LYYGPRRNTTQLPSLAGREVLSASAEKRDLKRHVRKACGRTEGVLALAAEPLARDELEQFIKEMAEQIERERRTATSEAKTVLKYVIPMLQALGWSVQDDTLVPEWGVQGKSVDLALVVEEKPAIFVEAKRLREDLSLDDKEAEQALDYGYKSGTKWCVLTNGERYEIYDAFAQVDHARKLVDAFSIRETAREPERGLPKVLLLSRESVTNGALEEYGRRKFAYDRVFELLEEPPAGVMSAICRELKDCGLSEAAVRTGLDQVLRMSRDPRQEDEDVGASAQQLFEWHLDIQDNGEFLLDVRFLPDERQNFRVSGTRVPPSGDFKPARRELLYEIYERIRPLFPDLTKNRVRAKAWSGVHKVYPSREYAPSDD